MQDFEGQLISCSVPQGAKKNEKKPPPEDEAGVRLVA